MNGIISEIKNIVIIIVASEFLKVFLLEDSFRKYITVCVNIIVIGFIVCEIKNVPFNINTAFEMPSYTLQEQGSIIKDEYERKISEELKKKFREEKILVYEVKTEANEDYSIQKIIVSLNGSKEKAEKIIKGMKPNSYEINVNAE